MTSIRNCLALIKFNTKIIVNLNVLSSLALICLTPFFFGLEMLTYSDMAKVSEIYLGIIGILLLPYLACIEEELNATDITYVKRIPHTLIFIIRLCLGIFFSFIMIGFIINLAKIQQGTFPLWELWVGTLITAVYFGVIGLTVANFTKNVVAGYLFSFAYYILEIFTRGKFTGKYFALSLLKESFVEKHRILILIVLLLMLNIYKIYKES